MESYHYESLWRKYAFPRQENELTSPDQIKEKLLRVDLCSNRSCGSGTPIISDGKECFLNQDTDHTLFFGTTGSGKSRCGGAPTTYTCLKAGDSIPLIDVKGEYALGAMAPYIRGTAEALGYNQVFFDLRSFSGDSLNVLAYPYDLYRNGKKDLATELVGDLMYALSEDSLRGSSDPFWPDTAFTLLLWTTILLFGVCDVPEMVNLLSLISFLNDRGAIALKKASNKASPRSLIFNQLSPILDASEKTRASIFVEAASMLQKLSLNKSLLKMICTSTFSLNDLIDKKTILYLILPDEKSTYDPLVSIIINQQINTIVQAAYDNNGSLPRRVDFIADEFPNIRIPNMDRYISTLRSRNVRFFLFCQSLEQLKASYPKEASTILANCRDIIFLNGQEESTYRHLVDRMGYTTVTKSGQPEPLISQQKLQTLEKQPKYAQAFYSSAKKINSIVHLSDISQYPVYRTAKRSYTLPHRVPQGDIPVYTPENLYHAVEHLGSKLLEGL